MGTSSRQGWLPLSSFFSWLGRRVGLYGELNNRLNSSFTLFKLCSSPVRRHSGFYFSVVPWQHVSGVAKQHGRLPICNANEVFEDVWLQSFFLCGLLISNMLLLLKLLRVRESFPGRGIPWLISTILSWRLVWRWSLSAVLVWENQYHIPNPRDSEKAGDFISGDAWMLSDNNGADY